LGADRVFSLQDDDFPTGAGKRPSDREADHPGTHHDALDAIHAPPVRREEPQAELEPGKLALVAIIARSPIPSLPGA
jgi:hypothetical protein